MKRKKNFIKDSNDDGDGDDDNNHSPAAFFESFWDDLEPKKLTKKQRISTDEKSTNKDTAMTTSTTKRTTPKKKKKKEQNVVLATTGKLETPVRKKQASSGCRIQKKRKAASTTPSRSTTRADAPALKQIKNDDDAAKSTSTTTTHSISIDFVEARQKLKKMPIPLPFLVMHGKSWSALAKKHKPNQQQQNAQETKESQLLDLLATPNELSRDVHEQLHNKEQHHNDLNENEKYENGTVAMTTTLRQQLEDAREILHYPPFRSPQDLVCAQVAKSNEDVFFVAPCGFGKSACFVIPTYMSSTSITLVIEPLRALIESQINSLTQCGDVLHIERLKAREDMKKVEGEDEPNDVHCENRLGQLAFAPDECFQLVPNRTDGITNPKPFILFATPELVTTEAALRSLQILARRGLLQRIVIDEFDVVDEARKNDTSQEKNEHGHVDDNGRDYRKAYVGIFGRLRKWLKCPGGEPVPMLCLSATVSQESMLDMCKTADTNAPPTRVFVAPNTLPTNLIYSVEQKDSNEQVAARIAEILRDDEMKHQRKAQTICYCLKPTNCERMAKWLREHGLSVEILDGKANQQKALAAGIVERFQTGKTQIICATKALGRGFHANSIRFIFHAIMPPSLRDYIQETGRAGRDGAIAYCVLFFSTRDRKAVSDVIRSGGSRARFDLLQKVFEYATAGAICRYRQLVEAAVPKIFRTANHDMIRCGDTAMCDNCSFHRHCSRHCPMVKSASGAYMVNNCGMENGMESCRIQRYVDLEKTSTKKATSRSIGTSTKEIQKEYIYRMVKYDVTKFIGEILERAYHFAKKESFCISDDAIQEEVTKKVIKELHPVNKEKKPNNNNINIKDDNVTNGRSRKDQQSQLQDFLKSLFLEPRKDKRSSLGHFFWSLRFDYLSGRAKVSGKRSAEKNQGNTVVRKDKDVWINWETVKVLYRAICDGDRYFFLQFPVLCQYWPGLNVGVKEDLSNITDSTLATTNKTKLTILPVTNKASVVTELESTEESQKSSMLANGKENTHHMPIQERPEGHKHYDWTGNRYYCARLDKYGRMSMLPPETAFDRRLYRKFGTNRFLHINVKHDVPKKVRETFFVNFSKKFGRLWSLFWCRIDKTPQTYIMFAERGYMIPPEEEKTVDQLWNWCIPRSLNPSISIAKFFKRLKLTSSKTTAAGVLPPGSLELVPDFNLVEMQEIDGGGLISREALNFVWKEFNKENATQKQEKSQPLTEGEGDIDTDIDGDGHDKSELLDENVCPYSGFQGRIGGIKGCWVLDDALEGIKVQCRSSQVKYNLYQKSKCPEKIGQEQDEETQEVEELEFDLYHDPAYDTVEICSWDAKPSPATFNTRLVQLLEVAGLDEGVCLRCVESAAKELSKLRDDKSAFLEKLKVRQSENVTFETDNKDGASLFRMAMSKVHEHEPILTEKRRRYIMKEFTQMHAKAHYPCPESCYVRLAADHTMLLEEGEAYLSIEGVASVTKRDRDYIIAMRSPSYFKGDMRKLKLIHADTLFERAQAFVEPPGLPEVLKRTTKQRYDFFVNSKNLLILSVKGKRSEADRMCGGDYDGDTAWTCWNKSIVEQVVMHDAEDTSTYLPEPSEAANVCFWDTTLKQKLDYCYNFCFHQSHLGILAENLDKTIDLYGFDHPFSRALGRAAFLQVDVPYHKAKLAADVDERKIKALKLPHWKQKKNSCNGTSSDSAPLHGFRRSTTALGKIWDLMDKKINEVVKEETTRPDQRILDFVQKCLEKRFTTKETLGAIRRTMMNAIDRYQNEYSRRKQERCFDGLDEYHKQQRSTLIDIDEMLATRQLQAAVLYEQGSKCGNKLGLWFAWSVAQDVLCTIASQASSEKGEPLPLHVHGDDRQMLTRGRRPKGCRIFTGDKDLSGRKGGMAK